jgi:sulfatase maturation enzyme AslB (radical SAM superfamily)
MYRSKAEIIALNKKEYGANYDRLNRVSESDALIAEEQRTKRFKALEPFVTWGYHQTKIDCATLSRGCRIYGAGEWSCLFINGKCNCRCFYCPAQQDETGTPMTNSIEFHRVRDYVNWIIRLMRTQNRQARQER